MSRAQDISDVVDAIQNGEFDVVRAALRDRVVSINDMDSGGCSFLHWAAINNRTQIASFLIDSGIVGHRGGGYVNESPLQWAIRKRFYAMAELIFHRTHCDLAHKSSDGSDALHTAVKLDDMNGAFLLMHWGASPNTTDNNGDTPLLWTVKHKKNAKRGREMVKLLLQFGANPSQLDKEGGLTALHILACDQKLDLAMVFVLYQAIGPGAANLEDRSGLTPYTLAVKQENRKMTRFLSDLLLFNYFPYWFTRALSAGMIVLDFLLVHYFGLVIGCLIGWVVGTAFTVYGFQARLEDHLGRVISGTFIGGTIALLVGFQVHIKPHISFTLEMMFYLFAGLSAYSIIKFLKTNPSCVRTDNRNQLAAAIIFSSPGDGTDEEAELLIDAESDAAAQHELASLLGTLSTGSGNGNGMGGHYGAAVLATTDDRDRHSGGLPLKTKRSSGRLVKDAFTGQMQRVQDETDLEMISLEDGNAEKLLVASRTSTAERTKSFLRRRSLGPKLCGRCVCNMRSVAPHSQHHAVGTKHQSDSSSVSSSSSASGHAARAISDGYIAMATHCVVCDQCVLDQDHHSHYFGKCVGRGNRREFTLTLIPTALCALILLVCLKYVQYYLLCGESDHWFPGRVVACEWHTMWAQPDIFFLGFSAALLLATCLGQFHAQVSFVSRETTTVLFSRGLLMQAAPPRNRMIKNVYNFFRHGVFNITYPKLTRPQLSNLQSTPAVVEKREETEEEKAKRLLSRIDRRLQMSVEEGFAPGNSSSNGAAVAAAAAPETAASSAEKRKQTWQSMGQDEDYQSDYDYEFSSSRHNKNYRKHYKQLVSDSEGEDNEEAGRYGADGGLGGDDNSDDDDESAEERALLQRARKRLDSHDVSRSHSHGHHGHSHAPGEECPMHAAMKKSVTTPTTGLTVTPTVLSIGDRG